MLRDLLYAIRLQSKEWRYAGMVMLTLAICLGANIAVFSVVRGVVLEPLPVYDADRIVLMANRYPKAGAETSNQSSVGDYYDRLQAVTALEQQGMFQFQNQTVDTNSIPEQVRGMAVTPSMFPLLHARPAIGRSFLESEGEQGKERKVILSYALWREMFAGDRAAVGRTLRLSGYPYMIVGVMPQSFHFVNPKVRFWVPLAFSAEQKKTHHNNNWVHIGRLKPGATIEQVQQQVNAVNAMNLDRYPALREVIINAGFHTAVEPLKNLLIRDVKNTLYFLWAGAGFVLLIGLVNLASLVIARSSARVREMGTRIALGADTWQIGRQIFLENFVLSLVGCAVGLVAGFGVLQALSAVGLQELPRIDEVRIDAIVVLFGLAVAILSSLFLTLLHALFVSRLSLSTAVREIGRTGAGGRRSTWIRRLVVMAQ
ncbi:MAG TPA: ABC transporter permease, partial [Bryobacteraceae bacterium]|nr:ABC transporter permease [Bryobacteraceae bacterium]